MGCRLMWFKVDDTLTFNAKVVEAGNEAIGLWVRAGAWCSAQLTDGFLPKGMAIAMAAGIADAIANPMAPIERLLKVGLWVESEGGYQFHDWADYQPSAEEAKQKRKARSEAGKAGAAARWHGNSHSNSHDVCHSNSNGKKMPPSRPVPINKNDQTDEHEEDFAVFWSACPRKVGKGQARRAYKTARAKASAPDLLVAMQRFAEATVNADPKFVAHPATWLNGERWLDEAPAESGPLEVDGNTWDDWLMVDPMNYHGWQERWRERFGDRR